VQTVRPIANFRASPMRIDQRRRRRRILRYLAQKSEFEKSERARPFKPSVTGESAIINVSRKIAWKRHMQKRSRLTEKDCVL